MELEAKLDAKRLVLDEVVYEEAPELFFRGGKEEKLKFCETTLATDQNERDPVWKEAIIVDTVRKNRFGIFNGFGA